MIYIALGLVGLVILFAMLGFKIVPQAETMVIERLGKYHRTLDTGINVIWPIIDRATSVTWRYEAEVKDGQSRYITKTTKVIDLREQVFDYPGQDVITKDNVSAKINAVLYFRITDPQSVVYQIANLPDALEKLTQTSLRNVVGDMELDEMLTSREKINSELQMILDEVTTTWGVKVTRIELQDISPPADVREAMEKQMRAERDKRAAILEAQGIRDAQISRAEGEKRSAILEAEGQAQAREAVAVAEAAAIKKITAELQAGGANPAEYLLGVRYLEAFDKLAQNPNQKTVLMPLESTNILGAVGGLKELVKS